MTLRRRGGDWKLKEEAVDRTLWRTRVGRGYGPKTGYRMNDELLMT